MQNIFNQITYIKKYFRNPNNKFSCKTINQKENKIKLKSTKHNTTQNPISDQYHSKTNFRSIPLKN